MKISYQIGEVTVFNAPAVAIKNHEAAGIARLHRVLGDALRWQVVIKFRGLHDAAVLHEMQCEL
jgi:hypothetical protein